jgi:hypothetical protein
MSRSKLYSRTTATPPWFSGSCDREGARRPIAGEVAAGHNEQVEIGVTRPPGKVIEDAELNELRVAYD